MFLKGEEQMDALVEIGLKTILLYLAMVVIFRIMGKREIGELSLLDLVVFMMIAEIAALVIEDTDRSIWSSVVPMAILVIIQLLFAYISLKSKSFRQLMDGKPSIIINQGKIDERAMRKQRYNFDDLLNQLRQEGIGDVAEVEYAILESSGKLSVIKKGVSTLALPVMLDGNVLTENLRKLNIERKWLDAELDRKGYPDIRKISYCSFGKEGIFVDLMDEKTTSAPERDH